MVHVLESLLFSRHYNIATFVQTCAGCDCWYTEIECRWTLSPFTPGPQVEVLSTNDRTVSTRQQLPRDMPALPIHLWYPPSTAGGGDTEERKKLHSYTPYIVSLKSYHCWSSTHLQYLAYDVWYRIKVHPNTPTLMGWMKVERCCLHLLQLNRQGFTQKASVAWLCYLYVLHKFSCTIALRMYSPCTNILELLKC